ncbi:MAG: ABC transporter substrate-binding protein [Eubacteriales bacterium]|nr:ABC transporter substrate-binding protein [Eubacteriales bacterium]
MKKTLSLMLSLLLAFAPLPVAGVAAEDAPLTGEISVQAEKAWMEYYQNVADAIMEANPDAKINLIEMGAFDHLDTIDNTDAGNPDVADLFAIPADRIYGLTDAEVLGALDSEKLAEMVGGWEDFEAFNAGIGGNFMINDEYFAFPFNIETLIVFINAANAEATGIDLEKPIELTQVEDPATVLLPAFDAWYGVALTNSAEVELLGREQAEDSEEFTFFSDLTADWADLPEEKQAFFTALYDYWKLNFDANTTLFDPDAGWGYIDDTFTSGQAGVYRLGGPWDTASISEKANDGEDLLIKPITEITVNEKPLLHWKGGWGLAINSRIEGDEEKMALAEAMIAELVNPERAAELFNATGKILENVPAEVYEESEDLKDVDKEVIKAVIASYQDAPARPLFNEWGRVWDTYKNAVLSWNSVKPENVEAAYAELQASFVAMMETLAAEQ